MIGIKIVNSAIELYNIIGLMACQVLTVIWVCKIFVTCLNQDFPNQEINDMNAIKAFPGLVDFQD